MPRQRLTGHRQVALLGTVALVVLVVVGATGTVLTQRARTQLAEARLRYEEPLEHLDQMEVHAANLSSTLFQVLLIAPDDASARALLIAGMGQSHGAFVAAWERFEPLSLHLPGEEEAVDDLAAVLEISLPEGQARLATMGAVSRADAPAMARRLDELRSTLDAFTPLQQGVETLIELYQAEQAAALAAASDRLDRVVPGATLVATALGLPLLAAFAVLTRSTRRRELAAASLAAARQADADRNEFDARVQRALDMASTEAMAYPVVEAALAAALPEGAAELLVADSSRAHLHQVAATGGAGVEQGCGVASPSGCPAALRGQTQVFASSGAIDACPHLRGRPGGACSAICVPVGIGGTVAGVLHAVGPDGEPAGDEVVTRIELVARKVGDRIGMLRAFDRSETQARTDPLTGLLNRRSLELDVRELTEAGDRYVVAYGDLDHFKQINDVHGHDTGDRALRLFAQVLRDGVRPTDLPARYGGEEFVIVFPACSPADAGAVVERLRERLQLALLRGSVPRFTVSFGVAAAEPGDRFADVVERADLALLEAKAAGRDRTVVRGGPSEPLLPI